MTAKKEKKTVYTISYGIVEVLEFKVSNSFRYNVENYSYLKRPQS